MYKIATTFDIVKWEDDYTLEDFNILYSHPNLEGAFMFHEDLLDYFLDMDDYSNLKVNHIHRVFFVAIIHPMYSIHHEYGKEFDGWEFEILVITSEDLGEVEDDSSLQSK